MSTDRELLHRVLDHYIDALKGAGIDGDPGAFICSPAHAFVRDIAVRLDRWRDSPRFGGFILPRKEEVE